MENYNSKLSVEKIFYLFSEPDYLIWCNLLQGNNSFLFEKKSEFTHTKFARSVLTEILVFVSEESNSLIFSAYYVCFSLLQSVEE